MTSNPTPPLVTRPVVWFLLFTFVANACLSLQMSALPYFAEQTTGRTIAAGLTTGVTMLATVLVELGTPGLISRRGYRWIMQLGMILIGFPTLLLLAYPNLATILLVSLARGAGLGITMVAGTALAARMFPPQRRSEGLGLFGLVVSVAGIALLPLGLWITQRVGFDTVAMVSALGALVGLAIGLALPTLRAEDSSTDGIVSLLLKAGILRPTVIFACSTLASGILITYLDLAVPTSMLGAAEIALVVQAICTSAARWISGRVGDQIGSARLLAPSMLLAAVGMMGVIAVGNATMILIGMALFGFGLGGAQNASLAIMFERAGPGRNAQVSVIWNIAFDASVGVGAVAFGILSVPIGYSWGFALVALLLFVSVVPAWRDRTTSPVPV